MIRTYRVTVNDQKQIHFGDQIVNLDEQRMPTHIKDLRVFDEALSREEIEVNF